MIRGRAELSGVQRPGQAFVAGHGKRAVTSAMHEVLRQCVP